MGGKTNDNYSSGRFVKLQFMLPKGKRELLKTIAEDNGISVTQLVLRAVETKYNIHLPRRHE